MLHKYDLKKRYLLIFFKFICFNSTILIKKTYFCNILKPIIMLLPKHIYFFYSTTVSKYDLYVNMQNFTGILNNIHFIIL